MSNKTFIAAVAILLMLIPTMGSLVRNVAEANPTFSYPPFNMTDNPNWVYVTTITGNSSQTVNILLPDRSHWSFRGNYTAAPGNPLLKINDFQSGGIGLSKSTTYPVVRIERLGSEGQGNIQLNITTSNILQYTLIVEYDSSTNETTSTTPSYSPSPTPSPSLAMSSTAPEFTPVVVLVLAVAVAVGVGALLVRKRQHA